MKIIIILLALIAAALLYVKYRKPGAALPPPVTETVQVATKAARDAAMSVEKKAHDLLPVGGQVPTAVTSNPRVGASPLERVMAREQFHEVAVTAQANPTIPQRERSVYERILAGESLRESAVVKPLPGAPTKKLSTYEQILHGARITEVTKN